MDIVYKASDPLDEFYRICDEHSEEMSLEARRKLYEEKDFNCVYGNDHCHGMRRL